MRLRNGNITTDNEAIQKRRYMSRMENPPNNNGETTAAISLSKAIPSTASTTAIQSNFHSGPILSLVRKQGQQVTPPLVGFRAFRPYVVGFTMPLNSHKQPYCMPTPMMANLHNVTSTLVDPVVNMFSPVQGSRSPLNNMGRINPPLGMGFSTQQMLNFTINSAAVLRWQMDESNHEMVHMLSQKMGTIFNPLIQNTTQTNQHMVAQMT